MKYSERTCTYCGRARVYDTGICEKCQWDNDANNWGRVTRPDEFYEGVYEGKEQADYLRRMENDYGLLGGPIPLVSESGEKN